MTDYLYFALLGLGSGAVYALIGCGLVVAKRGADVINFAHGSIAMACTFVFADLNGSGVLRLPILGLPTPQVTDGPMGVWWAASIAVLFAALIGLLVHYVVFEPLRHAPPLARVVASVGLMLLFQAAAQMRYGEARRQPKQFLPTGRIEIGSYSISVDRLWLAAIAVAIVGLLWLLYHRTSFGRQTHASSSSTRAAALLGVSASHNAAINWVIACVLAAIAGMLIAPIGGVDVTNYTLFVVPALGAALLGRFVSFGIACAGGFAIGMLQGVVSQLQIEPWVPAWAKVGLKDGLPFVVVLVVVAFLGPRIPTRGTITRALLPPVPSSGGSPRGTAVLAVVAVAAILASSGGLRLAINVSMIFAITALSLVVLTGFVGQISLAQAAFAGAAGFTAARLGTDAGVPVILAQLIAVLAGIVLGALVGLPVLRTRGVTLAVVTLAAGVAVEQFVFKNEYFSGGSEGAKAPELSYFGWTIDRGVGHGFPSVGLSMFIAASLCAVFLGVGVLRRSTLGHRMLAVRANEMGAAAAGIHVARVRLIAFCLSAAIAGWGGVLTAHLRGQITSTSFGIFVSLNVLALAYIGGIARPAGAVVGSMLAGGGVITFVFDRYFDIGQWAYLLSGLALVFMAVMHQNGLAADFDHVGERFRDRSDSSSSEGDDDEAAPSGPPTAPLAPDELATGVR